MSIHITFPDGAVKPFDSGIKHLMLLKVLATV